MNKDQTLLGALNRVVELLSPSQVCVGFETLIVTTSSLGLASIPLNATGAIIQVESDALTAAIRYREDGIAPTSSVGKFKNNGDEVELITNQSLQQFRVIQGTSGSTTLNISYYK